MIIFFKPFFKIFRLCKKFITHKMTLSGLFLHGWKDDIRLCICLKDAANISATLHLACEIERELNFTRFVCSGPVLARSSGFRSDFIRAGDKTSSQFQVEVQGSEMTPAPSDRQVPACMLSGGQSQQGSLVPLGSSAFVILMIIFLNFVFNFQTFVSS